MIALRIGSLTSTTIITVQCVPKVELIQRITLRRGTVVDHQVCMRYAANNVQYVRNKGLLEVMLATICEKLRLLRFQG